MELNEKILVVALTQIVVITVCLYMLLNVRNDLIEIKNTQYSTATTIFTIYEDVKTVKSNFIEEPTK